MSIGVGIIATGSIADNAHAPAVSQLSDTKLVAVLTRDANNGKDFVQRHDASDASVHLSLEDFVDDEKIDLVIICSPDGLHYEQALACLNAGKHVLLEKPMTTSVETSQELIEVAEKNDLVFAIGFHLRSHKGHRILANRLKELGKLRHIRVQWTWQVLDDSNWRANSEYTKWWSLSGVGSHCIDLSRWLTQDHEDWKQLTSIINTDNWGGPHDETAVVAGQLHSGVTVEVTTSVLFESKTRLEIYGHDGFAICEDTLGRHGGGTITINNSPVDFEQVSPFAEQLQNVVDCIKGKEALNAPATAGLRSVKDLLDVINS